MNGRRDVGPDIIALIHHIELNESGWVTTAIRKAIRFLFWMIGEPADINMILNERGSLGLDKLTREQAETAINELLEAGVILPVSNNKFKLAETEMQGLEQSIKVAENVETHVRNKVAKAAQAAGFPLEDGWEKKLWDGFHKEFIVPFIREFGARAYELMTGANTNVRQNIFISDFLGNFSGERRSVLEAMILAILDKSDQDCRKYILRLLNSFFFQSSVSLPKRVAERAFAQPGHEKRLRLVLDTNFLFSLFRLHSNPSNEAVAMLQGLIKRVPRPFLVDVYVLPSTIDEFQRSINYYQGVAENIRPTANIVSAAVKSNVSGVIEAFLVKAQDSGYKVNAKDYFAPYLNDIKAILGAYGVHVLNGEDRKYATDQATIDDALDQKSFYASKVFDGKKDKSYESIWHDMVLWHFVSDKRPSLSDTIFDAEWVGVTIDFGFIAFDNHKRRGSGVPVLVHPASLVQALQIIIPSDEDLEKTILALMQMPFLFEQFDVEDERATQKILGTLSMYESIDELGEETLLQILGNKILRTKIGEAQDSLGEVALIRDAIVEHLAEKTREADAAKAHLVAMQQQLEDERQRGSTHLETVRAESSARLTAAIAEKERAEAAKLSTDAELADIRAQLANIQNREEEQIANRKILSEKWRFFWSVTTGFVFSVVIISIIQYFSPILSSKAGWLAPITLQITVGVFALMACKYYVNRLVRIGGWWPTKALKLISNLSWATYAAVVACAVEPRVSNFFEKGLLPNFGISNGTDSGNTANSLSADKPK